MSTVKLPGAKHGEEASRFDPLSDVRQVLRRALAERVLGASRSTGIRELCGRSAAGILGLGLHSVPGPADLSYLDSQFRDEAGPERQVRLSLRLEEFPEQRSKRSNALLVLERLFLGRADALLAAQVRFSRHERSRRANRARSGAAASRSASRIPGPDVFRHGDIAVLIDDPIAEGLNMLRLQRWWGLPLRSHGNTWHAAELVGQGKGVLGSAPFYRALGKLVALLREDEENDPWEHLECTALAAHPLVPADGMGPREHQRRPR